MEEKITSGRLVIKGGKPLIGEVEISGAKNSALKLLAAVLLTAEPVEIENIPQLQDVTVMMELLCELGVSITFCDQGVIRLEASKIECLTVPYDLVKAMRASIVVLGPLLTRFQDVKVALPGGCNIGPRPIDIHLAGLKAMGAEIDVQEGFVHAYVKNRLKGAKIAMRMVSVTATENLMMAATLAEGVTVLKNAAREPEVVDLANFLNQMGAKIIGAGTSKITITGVESLHGTRYKVMSDRIEAGTYLVAAVMTKGNIKLRNISPECMKATLIKLKKTGAKIETTPDSISLDMQGKEPKAVDIETAPYPGFATDMQAQFVALNTIANGISKVTETIFENRFMHVPELVRLGANIQITGRSITCQGVKKLSGAPVLASDLRASACLVLAGLVAEGETQMEGVGHMDRGYSNLEEKLRLLGAEIRRVTV